LACSLRALASPPPAPRDHPQPERRKPYDT
jgi:hypothetical protein